MPGSRAIVLYRNDNSAWPDAEVELLRSTCGEAEVSHGKPSRVILKTDKPYIGSTLEEMLDHSNFTLKRVTYEDRWDNRPIAEIRLSNLMVEADFFSNQ